MSAKHTPGPWSVARTVGLEYPVVLEISGCSVAKTDCSLSSKRWIEDFDTAVANARLIAAAPELLEALEECRKLLEFLPLEYVHKDGGGKMVYSDDGALAMAYRAIAKAKGSR